MDVMVVDDEPLARHRLRWMVGAMPGYVVIAEAAGGESALTCACGAEPDVVLLGAHVRRDDRLLVATRLAELAEPPVIIFTVAYRNREPTVLARRITDYLLKPVRQRELEQALSRAARPSRAQLRVLIDAYVKAEPYFITAHTRDGDTRIALDDVIYFQAEDKYTTVYHRHGRFLASEPLNALEQRFADAFVRIHRSTLVAKRFITDCYVDAGGHRRVRLCQGDKPLHVSRRRLTAVHNLFDYQLPEFSDAQTSYRNAPEQTGDVAGRACAGPPAGRVAWLRCDSIADSHER